MKVPLDFHTEWLAHEIVNGAENNAEIFDLIKEIESFVGELDFTVDLYTHFGDVLREYAEEVEQ